MFYMSELPIKETAGDTLKIRYKNREGSRGFFSPGNVHIEINGVLLKNCTEINVSISANDYPFATLSFTLDELDIDTPTMVALDAYLKYKDKKDKDAN